MTRYARRQSYSIKETKKKRELNEKTEAEKKEAEEKVKLVFYIQTLVSSILFRVIIFHHLYVDIRVILP